KHSPNLSQACEPRPSNDPCRNQVAGARASGGDVLSCAEDSGNPPLHREGYGWITLRATQLDGSCNTSTDPARCAWSAVLALVPDHGARRSGEYRDVHHNSVLLA